MKGIGLSRIPEVPRFFLTITAIVLMQFATGIDAAAFIFITGVVLLALNLRLKNWKFLLFFLSLTFFVLLVGNILFSPSGCGGGAYWIFIINPCGISLGIENALKRSAMILVGWAWFEATGYQSAVSLFTGLSAVLIGKERSFRYVGTGFAFASRVGQELSVARLNAELLFPKKILGWKNQAIST